MRPSNSRLRAFRLLLAATAAAPPLERVKAAVRVNNAHTPHCGDRRGRRRIEGATLADDGNVGTSRDSMKGLLAIRVAATQMIRTIRISSATAEAALGWPIPSASRKARDRG